MGRHIMSVHSVNYYVTKILIIKINVVDIKPVMYDLEIMDFRSTELKMIFQEYT